MRFKQKLVTAVVSAVVATPVVMQMPNVMTVSPEGVQAVKVHEALRLAPYYDAVKIPTICYGSTLGVSMQTPVHTEKECEARLAKDLNQHEDAVRYNVKVPLTQGQYDALVSFTFNVGNTAFRKSTLLRKVNAGQCLEAGAEFDRWVYAKGKRLNGLVYRRAAERAEWDKGCAAWSV